MVWRKMVAAYPRGWGGVKSHQRKQRSYEVEVAFYQQWTQALPAEFAACCRLPRCWGSRSTTAAVQVVLEDLMPLATQVVRSVCSRRAGRPCSVGWRISMLIF